MPSNSTWIWRRNHLGHNSRLVSPVSLLNVPLRIRWDNAITITVNSSNRDNNQVSNSSKNNNRETQLVLMMKRTKMRKKRKKKISLLNRELPNNRKHKPWLRRKLRLQLQLPPNLKGSRCLNSKRRLRGNRQQSKPRNWRSQECSRQPPEIRLQQI